MLSKRFFIFLFIVVIGFTFYSAFSGQTVMMEEKPEIGFKAPAFTLPSLSEEQIYSLDTSEKPLVINFWASWCQPCHLEAPYLAELYEEYKDRVEFYAINLTDSDSLDAVNNFVQQYEFTFPVLLDVNGDKKGEVNKAYRILAVPTTYFLDKNGIIVHKHTGYATKADLETQIRKLAN